MAVGCGVCIYRGILKALGQSVDGIILTVRLYMDGGDVLVFWV